jgi:NAD(P) transhydrogenase subunit alpha
VIVGVPRERSAGERRVALVPDGVRQLVGAGLEVGVEAGAGAEAGYPDEAYAHVGARLEADAGALLRRADVVVKVNPPVSAGGRDEAEALREGAVWIGFLRPLDEPEVARRLARRNVTAFALELVPRITRAQSMDALSSQNNVAGYRAVVLGAYRLGKLLPMMVTAAGTISQSRVFVIGAGVAGLQAIATAKRLGAVVEAYDMRPVVKEQVQSVGGRFVELELQAADAQDKGGYAKAQDEEFYRRQRALLAKHVAQADLVVTTALIPGQPAPRLIEAEAVERMRPGSVVVDLAAEKGGNCVLTRADEEVHHAGVTILGPTNLPSSAPFHASQMYSRNVTTFLQHLLEDGRIVLDLGDELTRAPLLTHEGKVVNERTRQLLEGAAAGA